MIRPAKKYLFGAHGESRSGATDLSCILDGKSKYPRGRGGIGRRARFRF
jgi:hypothetical protein